MSDLRQSGNDALASFSVRISPNYFLSNMFRMNSARTATFVNLIAQFSPRSFISGNSVDVDSVLQSYNKAEFHHIFPKAYIEREHPQYSPTVNSLANFCFLSRDDNLKIRAKAPSVYKSLMPSNEKIRNEILASALIDDLIFEDDFEKFMVARAERLASEVDRLIN